MWKCITTGYHGVLEDEKIINVSQDQSSQSQGGDWQRSLTALWIPGRVIYLELCFRGTSCFTEIKKKSQIIKLYACRKYNYFLILKSWFINQGSWTRSTDFLNRLKLYGRFCGCYLTCIFLKREFILRTVLCKSWSNFKSWSVNSLFYWLPIGKMTHLVILFSY